MTRYETVLEELRTIRDERRTAANTANRVGTALIDMLGLIGNLDYLPLTGGTMRNSNLVTNLNADLLDGHHADYFATEAALATLAGTVGSHTSAIATLESYFSGGVAKSALRLSGTATHSAWGRTYWENGQPKDLSGTLDGVMDINMTGVINIGGFRIERTADGLKFHGNIYATGGVAALGTTGSSGGDSGGGTGGAAYMRDLLDVSITTPVDGQVLTYQNGYWVAAAVSQQTMPDLSGYATRQWVEQQGYLTTHQSLAGYATEAYVQQACDSVVGHVASNFVAKVSGKDLSANDFTDALLAKLNGIEEGANKYVHPGGGANKQIAAAAGRVLSSVTVNSLGHVTAINSKTLAPADIPALTVSKISDFPTTWAWSKITGTPTKLAEYGITDAATTEQMTDATGRISTLESYFSGGVAKSALRLSGTATYTVWGQTYWQSGAPKGNVTGAMTGVTSIDSFVHLSSSRLGIGASSPAQRLHVAHDGRNMLRLERTDVSGQYVDIGVDDDGFNISAYNTSRSLWVNGDSYIDGNLEMGASLSIDGFIVERTEDGLKFHGNIYATGGVAALGTTGDSGGSTGGATYLRELLDVSIGTLSDGQVLTYRNGYWTPGSAPTADLSAYATQQWVEQNWQIKSMSTIYDDGQQALIYGDYIPYDIQLVNGVLTVTYAHMPFPPDVYWNEIMDRPDLVSALGVSGNYLTWTREGVTNNLTVPYATRASELAMKAVGSSSDLEITAGTFVFSGAGYLRSGYDYVGLQVGDSLDKWQLTLIDHLQFRQNDSGGTDATHWGAWRTLLDSSNWANYISLADYLPLSAGSSKPLTGNLCFAAYGRGVYLMDGAGYTYPGIYDNGTNLWIGAEQTTARHHYGNTIISAGHNGTKGNDTIFVSVPNADNNGGTNYGVWHSGNFTPGNYALASELLTYLPLTGGTLTGGVYLKSILSADSYATRFGHAIGLTALLNQHSGSDGGMRGGIHFLYGREEERSSTNTQDRLNSINIACLSEYKSDYYAGSYGLSITAEALTWKGSAVLHAGNFRAAMEYTSWTDFSDFAANVQTNYATKAQLAGYLPLSGGAMTGNISFKGTGGTNEMIRFINSGLSEGNGIAIGGGGATIIGGGESAVQMAEQVRGYNEVMYIGNDQNVSIFTYLQGGWENRKEFVFDTSGDLTLSRSVVSTAANSSAFRLKGTNYDIGLHLGAGGTNRGIYEFSPKNDWLIYFNANNTILNYGNVGIGTTTPNDYKLDVAGAIRASGSGGYGIVLDNDQAVTLRDSTGAHMRSMFLNSVNRLAIGYGTTKTGGYDTQLCGHEIILSTGGGSGTDPIEAARFTADGKLKIGNGYIEWDYTNQMLKFSGGNGIYAMGGVSALGIAGDIDGQVTRAMTFTEAVTMRKTLGVTGQLTLNNSSTLASSYALLANGKVRIASTLAVTGAATFGGALTVSGNTSLESTTISTLGVEGKSEFADDMMLDGKLIFGTGADDDCIYVNNGHLYFRPAGGSALLIK